jgi:phage terminase small subunit
LTGVRERLTDKQQAFCREYLVDWNATQAAMRAGYSQRTAYAIGAENLRKPQIRARIKELAESSQISPEEIIARLADQARGAWSDFIVADDDGKPTLDIEAMKQAGLLHLITSFTVSHQGAVTYRFPDPQKALELLGKAQGVLTDRQKVDLDMSERLNAFMERWRAADQRT